MKRIVGAAVTLLAVCTALFFLFSMYSMGGSHTYADQAQAYLNGAREVLITHGRCADKNDCSKKQLVFQSGGAAKLGPFEWGGPNVYVYEVASADLVGDLVRSLGETYKTQRGPRINMYVYETPHGANKKQFAMVQIE